jgi:exodeoxyribonuclease V gamma subunit
VPVQDVSPFAPDLLAWRVFEALGDGEFTADHPRLSRYLAVADPVMRLDLSRRIAQLVEHYITYRPQWLAAWSEKKPAGIPALDASGAEDEAWQAALWRRITAELGTAREHPAAAFFRRIEAMGADAAQQAALPPSAHVFCLPTLPPLYLEILRQLGRWTQIHLYVLNPCREYWFEIVAPKRLSYLAARRTTDYHEIGNSLLASWGKQTQAHIDLLLAGDDTIVESDSAFLPSGGTTLLARVQDAILDLEQPAPGSVSVDHDDRSIEVHVCHSLTRELEVLQDQLLALFAGPNPPRSGEILVATPDLEAAAPLIDAVFGTAPPQRRIPYRITGQAQRRINPVARALDALMALSAGRHAASAVFDLLQQVPVAQRFDLEAEDLDTIHDWIREAGIRWGLDGDERRALDLPADERHTFRDGLQRLYLAYALGEAQVCIDGRVGSGNPEGQSALALGRFWRYVEALRALRSTWQRPAGAEEWRSRLAAALETFVFPSTQWTEDSRSVQAAIGEMAQNMARGGLRGAVPLEVVRAALGEVLDDPARGGVPTGAVTFSAISSLRGLPYRIVCAIGMNDGAFPTAARPVEFDLMARQPQRGDRQRRNDERNLFLDLLLAARERFYLSYAGHSIRDNSAQPPSVLVSELLDYVTRACGCGAEAESAVRRRLMVEHPLQAFSPQYFLASSAQPRLRSFNAEYCEALRASLRAAPVDAARAAAAHGDDGEEDEEDTAAAALPFFSRPLPAPETEWHTVRLDQLARFFANPCRFLLRERLGIALPRPEEELLDEEPFLPDWPGRQALAERLLPALLSGCSEPELLEQARAGTDYPPGTLGDTALAAEIGILRRFASALQADLAEPPQPPHAAALDFEVAGEAWRLEGAIAELRSGALVRWRYDEARAADYLAGWIDHLFLCATLPHGAGVETRWHARDGIYRLKPCSDARTRLAQLVGLYRQGLSEPLRFFPKSAWDYVAADGNLGKARSRWRSTRERPFGEDRDPAYRLALRGIADPLDQQFVELAATVLQPLREHLEDPRQ